MIVVMIIEMINPNNIVFLKIIFEMEFKQKKYDLIFNNYYSMINDNIQAYHGYLDIQEGNIFYNAIAISSNIIITAGYQLCKILKENKLKNIKFHLQGKIYDLSSYRIIQGSQLILISSSLSFDSKYFPLLEVYDKKDKLLYCFINKKESEKSFVLDFTNIVNLNIEDQKLLQELSGAPILKDQIITAKRQIVGIFKEKSCYILFDQETMTNIKMICNKMNEPQYLHPQNQKNFEIILQNSKLIRMLYQVKMQKYSSFVKKVFFSSLVKCELQLYKPAIKPIYWTYQNLFIIQQVQYEEDKEQTKKEPYFLYLMRLFLSQTQFKNGKIIYDTSKLDEKTAKKVIKLLNCLQLAYCKQQQSLNVSQYVAGQQYKKQDRQSSKKIIGFSILQMIQIMQLALPENIRPDPSKFKEIELNLSHKTGLSLGGQNDIRNVMITTQKFNLSTMKIMENQITRNIIFLSNNTDLYKSFQYTIKTKPFIFYDKNNNEMSFSLIPGQVQFRTSFIKNDGTRFQGFIQKLNPWMKLYGQNQYKAYKNNVKSSSPFNLPKKSKLLLSAQQDQDKQINNFIQEQYNDNIKIIEQKLKDNKFTFGSEIFNVEITPIAIRQAKSISINIKDNCESFLQKTFKMNFLQNLLQKILKIKKITLSLTQQVLGYYLSIQSQPLDPPQIISKALKSIFHFNNPVINLNANIRLLQNLLGQESKPQFFSIGAIIKNQISSQDTIADIKYSFDQIKLDLYCSLDEIKDKYKIDWIIGSKIKIFNLTEKPIEATSSLGYVSSQYKLAADFRFEIQNFLNIKGLTIDGLQIHINFGQNKSLFLKMLLSINNVKIMIGGEYSTNVIKFMSSIQSLTMADIQQLINKFSQIQIKSGIQLTFEDIQLAITYDRKKQIFSYSFQIILKVENTTLQGKLQYGDNKLALSANADQIKFTILSKQFTLIEPSLVLQQIQNRWQLKYTGQIIYKSQIDVSANPLKVTTTINVQNKDNKYGYYLAAEVSISQEEKLQNCISLLSSSIKTLKLVYMTDNYQTKDKIGNIYLQASLQSYNLLGQTIDFNIICTISPLALKAQADFKQDNVDNDRFIVLKSASISAVIQGNPSIIFQLKCYFPKYRNILMTGSLSIKVGQIKASIQMKGKIKVCEGVQIGYGLDQVDKKSIIQIFFKQAGYGFTVQTQLQIFDVKVGGKITIIDNAPTSIEFSLKNFNLSRLINFIKKLISSRNKQKDPEPVQQCSNLLVINDLTFAYDILEPSFLVKINVIILENQFILNVSYKKASFNFQASIEHPISILDIINISSAKDDKKGPEFKMSLNTNNGFNLLIDGKLTFGPITAAAFVDIHDFYLKAKISLTLFSVKFGAEVTIDKEHNQYSFSVEFGTDLKQGASNYVKEMVVDQKSLKQQSYEANIQEELYDIMEKQNIFQSQFQQHKDKSKKQYIKKKEIMSNIYKYNNLGKFKNALLAQQKQQQIKSAQIQKLKQELTNLKNYVNYAQLHYKQSVHMEGLKDIKQKITDLQAKIQTKKSTATPLWDKDEHFYSDINQFYQCIKQSPQKLQGAWDSFTSWVKNAYNTIAKFVKKIIEVVLPIITYFKIGASIEQQTGWNFNASFALKFKFLGKEYDISYKWNTHFDQKIIQKTAIHKMVNISLEVVRVIYIIPKPIYQTFRNYSLSNLYEEIKKKNIKGINISYQSEINYKEQKKVFYLDLKIGPVAPIDVSKTTIIGDQTTRPQNKQYNLCLSRRLDFQLTENKDKILKQIKLQVFFCDYLYPKTQLLQNFYSLNKVNMLNDYVLSGPRQMRGIILANNQQTNKIAQWPYQSMLTNIYTQLNATAIRLFKSIEVTQDKEVYMTYQFENNFILTLKNGIYIQIIKIEKAKDNKEYSYLWKQIPYLNQVQPKIE